MKGFYYLQLIMLKIKNISTHQNNILQLSHNKYPLVIGQPNPRDASVLYFTREKL